MRLVELHFLLLAKLLRHDAESERRYQIRLIGEPLSTALRLTQFDHLDWKLTGKCGLEDKGELLTIRHDTLDVTCLSKASSYVAPR